VKILLTGSGGQLGWELRRALAPLGELAAFDRAGLDLADPGRIRSALREINPAIIVNAAAYTAVDRAESERDAAFAINARAPGVLAEEALRLGALLIHYSTDYVFDGTKSAPYTEEDTPNPLGVYGASKLEGEQAILASGAGHWIFRTSWVYAPRGKNFLLTILRVAREGKPLRVVADQYGAPTSAAMLARATAQALSTRALALSTRARALSSRAQALAAHTNLVATPPSGMYHMTAAGRTSWHGFASAILAEFGLHNPIAAIPAAEYPLPAKRPANSVLDNSRLAAAFGIRLPDWEAGLREATAELLQPRR
jgi:dTDP-4-dehydrorhamnose reductase